MRGPKGEHRRTLGGMPDRVRQLHTGLLLLPRPELPG